MEEKTCKYCQKQVDAKAIKCPYCQEWLNKTSFTWRNPYFIPVLLIICGFGFLKFVGMKSQKLAKSFESIKLKDSHKLSIQNITVKKNNNFPRIIADIENKEPFAWNSVEVMAIYLDKKNKPIYLGSSFISNLKVGEKRPFQISGPCANENVSFADYDHYELKIETAYAYPDR